jgi:signal transduction histidine kinase
MQAAEEVAPALPTEVSAPRAGAPGNVLFRRYAAVLMGLVGGALLLQGLVDIVFDYRETREAAEAVQRTEVRAAAGRIEQYLASIEHHMNEVGNLPWGSGVLGLQDRRDEYHRLMKLMPAVAELRSVGPDGLERIRASRVFPDEVLSRRDWRDSVDFSEAKLRGLWYSPTFFKEGSEPFLTLAMRDREATGMVTLAEINLRYVGEVVSRIRIGAAGIVYVVDGADHVVAHPDVAVVLSKTSLSGYEPLRRVRAASAAADVGVVGMFAARALDGTEVMISAAPIPSAGWLVVAEQPRSEVLGPLYGSLTRTLAAMLAGIAAALVASYMLAGRLARPILELRRGAEKIARGDLTTRIDVRTGDDIETLAGDFNRMADQLQDYTVGLERKVSEKTAQLEAANRHKSEFLANMSHELRTPLNAVIGFSEALREEMFGKLNPKQMEYVGDIHGSGLHLLSLINDILDLAKVESGHMELELREFDVGAAVGNCCTLVRERAMRQSLGLTVDVPPGLTWCADERKFKQVLLNLVTNALKFTAAGGKVRVEARVEGDELAVAVSDNGPGIAPADQGVIFEQFRQLPDEHGARQEGTGLGLPLSLRMVELHGGTLTVLSEPGKGSTFTARYPRLGAP